MRFTIATIVALACVTQGCSMFGLKSQLVKIPQKKFHQRVTYIQTTDKRVWLDAKINEHNISLLFDTGSGAGYVPTDSVRNLNIRKLLFSQKERDITGSLTRVRRAVANVDLSSIRFENAVFSLTSNRRTSSIGRKTIAACNWLINPSSGELIVSDSYFNAVSAKYLLIEYPDYSMPFLDCSIDNIKQRFGIDYGAGNEIILSSDTPLAQYLMKKYTPEPLTQSLSGTFASKENVRYYNLIVPELDMGILKVRNVKLAILEGGIHNLIGAQLLTKFRVIINSNWRKGIDNYHQMIIEEL